MRILYTSLEPPFPATSGHRIRLAVSLRALAEAGHEITLISFAAPGAEIDPATRRVCRDVEFVPLHQGRATQYGTRLRALASSRPYNAHKYESRGFRGSVARHLAARDYDLIICDEMYHVQNIPPECPARVAIDTHLITWKLYKLYVDYGRSLAKRAYVWSEYVKMRRWERRICSRADMLWACSELEAEEWRAMCPGTPVRVVPNAIDVEEYGTPDALGDGRTLLYTGAMEWFPNQDAASFLIAEILPRVLKRVPGARFIAAGRGVPDRLRRRFASSSVEFASSVPDIRPLLARAAVCVVPLRIASGTRLKILEAAAKGKAVVSTDLGAEGLNFKAGVEIMLRNDPAQFADAVSDLLLDEGRRAAMGSAARRRVEQEYSLKALGKHLSAALEMAKGKRAAPG